MPNANRFNCMPISLTLRMTLFLYCRSHVALTKQNGGYWNRGCTSKRWQWNISSEYHRRFHKFYKRSSKLAPARRRRRTRALVKTHGVKWRESNNSLPALKTAALPPPSNTGTYWTGTPPPPPPSQGTRIRLNWTPAGFSYNVWRSKRAKKSVSGALVCKCSGSPLYFSGSSLFLYHRWVYLEVHRFYSGLKTTLQR